MKKCFAVRYSGVDFYIASTKEDAIEMFKNDSSHTGEDFEEVEG